MRTKYSCSITREIIERGRQAASSWPELNGHYAAMWNKQKEAGGGALEKLKEVENDPGRGAGDRARATPVAAD